jgi:Uncharacterised protein conserved in bacteria (DUF2313)
MVITPQPTLPPEELFTDPEFNFMEESPRGFFPENQDSNWGYRRKVFSDVIWEIYQQLHLIYSEIFPASSQTYLDEWEYMVGLPQNPANKTLQQRRVMVMNRLRGGPFTRTQRRNIVESYITATFGDPIILLPPGHGMEIGGSPLYNEPGDVRQLYMIVETIPSFQYEVRIKTGMALDQVGLERDLRWYTPAGIFIIFNYAWEGKFPIESGTGVDSIASRKITTEDTGIGSEGVRYTGIDTGVGTDTGIVGIDRTDTGAGVDTALAPIAKFDLNDEITSVDLGWQGKRDVTPDADAGIGTDNGVQT